MRASAVVVLLAALGLQAPFAHAEPAAREVRAEALFEEGKRLFDAGRFVEACRTLATSQLLEPRVGTLGLLASCHEQQGRIATAWREYVETAARAQAIGDPREKFARDRAAALEPSLPTLLVRVRATDPALEVLRDGEALRSDDWGIDLFVDPGSFELLARAPGKKTWRQTITLEPGLHAEVEIPPLEPLSRAATPARSPPVRSGPSAARVLAYVAGGTGVAGVGVGVGFGLLALSKSAESSRYCDEQDVCSARGGALRDEARSLAHVSTAGFAVGVAGAVTGVALALATMNQTHTRGARSMPSAPAVRVRGVAATAAPRGGGVTMLASFQ